MSEEPNVELRVMGADELRTEVRRLIDDERERDAAALVQRQGEVSLAAYLEKCFRADSADAWLLDRLCRDLWAADNIDAVEAALRLPTQGEATAMRDAWKVLVWAQKGEKEVQEAGLAGLAVMVRISAPLRDFPIFAERELASHRCLRELDTALEAAVADESIGMSFAGLYTRRACNRKQWDVRRHFAKWIKRGGDGAADPVAAFMEVIGDAREGAGIVPEIIAEHGEWMRRQTRAFGKCGYALVNSGLHADAAVWLEGCEKRADLQGWMAANQVLALWRLGRYLEAANVAAEVLRRELRDNTWDWNAAAAAFGHALAQRTDEAQAALVVLVGDGEKHADFYWAAELARSIVRAQKLPRDETRRVFHEERQRLQRVLQHQALKVDPFRARERYRLALAAIAQRGGFRVWPWQNLLKVAGSDNPMLSRWWLAGVALLLLAVLRSCMAPGDPLYLGPNTGEDEAPLMPSPREAREREIQKLMSTPKGAALQ